MLLQYKKNWLNHSHNVVFFSFVSVNEAGQTSSSDDTDEDSDSDFGGEEEKTTISSDEDGDYDELSSDEEETTSIPLSDEELLRFELSIWMTKHHITYAAGDELLSIIGKRHSSLPKCSKTLFNRSSKAVEVCPLSGGVTYNFGLGKQIIRKLAEQDVVPNSELT